MKRGENRDEDWKRMEVPVHIGTGDLEKQDDDRSRTEHDKSASRTRNKQGDSKYDLGGNT